MLLQYLISISAIWLIISSLSKSSDPPLIESSFLASIPGEDSVFVMAGENNCGVTVGILLRLFELTLDCDRVLTTGKKVSTLL